MVYKLLIGVSGKMGAGKNYLAQKLSEEFIIKGFTTTETSFATPLKDEATQIINHFHQLYKDNVSAEIWDNEVLVCSEEMNILESDINQMLDFIKDDLNNFDVGEFSGWTKTEGVRRMLQYLGTEVRRKQNPTYWTDAFINNVPDGDIVFVPDVRFPNEADTVSFNNGVVMRVEVPREIILARASARDKLRYSSVAENHTSETGMDEYLDFDFVVGPEFDAKKLVNEIISLTNLQP